MKIFGNKLARLTCKQPLWKKLEGERNKNEDAKSEWAALTGNWQEKVQ